VIVSAPASSANLGSGFDCLGLALDLPFELCDTPLDRPDWLVAEPTHPAVVAFRAAGGDPAAELRWRSPIPPGRGMGFSGAARVAGAYLGARRDGLDHDTARQGAYVLASELEGHADNAAASALGGFTVAAGEHAVSLEVPDGLSVVVWWPEQSTSTAASRRVLAEQVPLRDAVGSIAGAALWVAALGVGRLDLLRTACEDRLHQPARLAARPDAAAVLASFLGHEEVLAAWLSGSGPTIAALVREGTSSDELVASPGAEGHSRRVGVDRVGVVVTDS
jgi:homoserine kinase